MKRAYGLLFAGTLLLGVMLASHGRQPGRAAPRAVAPKADIADSISLTIHAAAVSPPSVSVEKGRVVRLRVENLEASPVRLTLAGYSDRVSPGPIAPGSEWRGEFLADRPGEDFAWLLDGKPAGRFIVFGSHLVEGHR